MLHLIGVQLIIRFIACAYIVDAYVPGSGAAITQLIGSRKLNMEDPGGRFPPLSAISTDKSSLLQTLDGPLRVAGPIFFLGLQWSSIRTARQILRRKSVGQLSSFPFISLLTNCFIWTLYGYLKGDRTVFLPNLSGTAVAMYCIYAFHLHVAVKPIELYSVSALLICLSVALALARQAQWIGWMGCGLSVVLSGSPLAALRTVVSSRSTASMPFATSLVTFLSNLSWLCYGLLIANDPVIYGPGSLGFLLSVMQMILFLIYGVPKSNNNKAKEEEIGQGGSYSSPVVVADDAFIVRGV